jgi:hypothetical protein
MSIKSKIFAGAASLMALGGVGAAGMVHASAATPSCGHRCIDLYNELWGRNYLLDSIGQGTRTGNKVILYQASNSDPALDWTIVGYNPNQPTDVHDFYKAGLVSSAVDLHYSHDIAFEIEYSPLGRGTNECLGTARTAGYSTPVSLQPCGASSKTVWIVDVQNVQSYSWQHYVPLINGSDTNFDDPYVLHYPGGNPNDRPRPQLTTYPLLQDSRHVVNDDEEWGVKFGTAK